MPVVSPSDSELMAHAARPIPARDGL
jgi:hypothetical protein